MSKLKAIRCAVAMFVLAGVFMVAGLPTHGVVHAAEGGTQCPHHLLPAEVRMEIVSVVYVEEVQSTNGVRLSMKDENKEKFRIALVTVKVTKPAGESLTVAAADLTLHYFHGSETEVAPCEALSSFSSVEDTDRPLNMFGGSGPGWVKQTTGTKSAQSDVLYFDCVFNQMEPDSNNMWLCVGQPTVSQPFTSEGWEQ